jgi:hypothetical protein
VRQWRGARRSLVAILLLVWGLGCAPVHRDDLVKEVLAADPSFNATLDKHQELSSRIETFERELALKRSTTEQQITALRKDLTAAAARVRAKKTQTKELMEPDRERLRLALSMAGEELRATQAQRASMGRSIAQLRKSLKQDEGSWAAEERAARRANLEDMLHDAQRLDQEMAALKEHVRLLKIKLLLIKL